MKFKNILAVFVFLFCYYQNLFSANQEELSKLSGLNLCNTTYKYLEEANFSPLTQALINNGNNTFPYNIYLKIDSIKQNSNNLLLIFQQEQAIFHQDLIVKTLNFIKDSQLNSNIIVLFSYGDNQIIEKETMIYGTEIFINSLNSNEDYTAIFFDLNNNENKVLTSSSGITSPSWLISNEYNIFLKEGLKKNLPIYYLSQIYSMKLFNDLQLQFIFENEIQGIKVCLNEYISSNETGYRIITNSIQDFDENSNNIWDKHFLLINVGTKYLILSESIIVNIIICITFILMCFIFGLVLFNTRINNNIWYRIKKIWYSIPFTLVVTYLTFLLGKNIFSIFINKTSPLASIYFCISIQIILSFIFITLIYDIFLIINSQFIEKSIDFLILISCFIIQSLFILIDISLFPIFVLIFLFSLISYFIKNNLIHIFVFLLMIIVFVPYANIIITTSNISNLQKYVYENQLTPIMLSLILCPIYLLYLRILTSFRNYFPKKSFLFIISIIGIVSLFIFLFSFSFMRIKQLEKTIKTQTNYTIVQSTEDLISFDYSDKIIFNDIIRTIKINLKNAPLVCDVRVTSTIVNPVLYSDNDFKIISPTSVIFKIPENPPSNLTFSYGVNDNPCNILISAIYPYENTANKYKLITKVISIEKIKEK